MSDTRWRSEHSRLVSLAEPHVIPVTTDELERVWRGVERELVVPKRSRCPVRVVVGSVVATLMLGVGGMAAAGVFTAHTGRYPGDAEDLRLGGPGERLDPAASDYGATIDAVTADIPFPTKQARAIARQIEVRDGRREKPGTASVSTGALRFWTARAAICAWSNVWVAPDGSVPAHDRSRAASALTNSPKWRAVADLDLEQSVAEQTEAAYVPLVRQAVLDNDRSALASALVWRGVCPAALTPNFRQASVTG